MNLDELENLAKAATPGPWEYELGSDDGFDHWQLFNPETLEYLVQDDSGVEPETRNLAFIAAANPATVLKLIAVVRAGKEAVFAPPLGNQIAYHEYFVEKRRTLQKALAELEDA